MRLPYNLLRKACQARRELSKAPSELDLIQAELVQVRHELTVKQRELINTRNSLGEKVTGFNRVEEVLRKQVEELETKQTQTQQFLEKTKQALEQTQQVLTEKQREISENRSSTEASNQSFNQVELALKSRVKELETELSQTHQQLDRTQLELKEIRNSVETEVSRFNQVELALKKQVEELEAEVETHSSLLDAAESKIGELQGFVDRELDMSIGSIKAQYETQVEFLESQIQALTRDNQEKQAMYDVLLGHTIQPRRFPGINPMEILGNKFIDALMMETKAVFDGHETGANSITLSPRLPVSPQLVKKNLELLKMIARLSVEQSLKVVGNKGLIEIEIVDPSKTKDKPKTESGIDLGVPADWFSNLILTGESALIAGVKQRPQHLKICGESESGKSATVSNGIDILKGVMPNLRVMLADPLSETGESSWNIPATWKTDDQCRNAIKWTAQLVEHRKAGKDQERIPTLVIVDEIDTLLEGSKDYAGAIKKIWKQGRHQGVWLWVLGQSPNATPFPGFNLSDFNNCICLYLNQTASYAIEQQKSIPSNLMVKYHDMTETERYITLVKPKRGKPFITASVKPDSFKEFTSTIPVEEISRSTESAEPPVEIDCSQEISDLSNEGLTASQIVEKIWKLKPSRSQEYLDRVEQVKEVIVR